MIAINNDIINQLFVSERYKLLRRILLALPILFITINFVWYIPDNYITDKQRFCGWIIHSFIFLSLTYVNIYIAIPRLLLKNRLMIYFLCVVAFVMTGMGGILFVQKVLWELKYTGITSIYILINATSGLLTFGLLFIGTTSIAVIKQWIVYNNQVNELQSSILESELKLLKNQINPHFLFNMLNNANVLLKKDKEEASRVLLKLEDMLRYQIKDSTKEQVLLSSDIHFLNDFLKLEQIRRDHFEYRIFTKGNTDQIKIPPFLFITFVENAIKHNPDNEKLSYVYVSFYIEDNKLEFICLNSKPVEMEIKKREGIGLKNIKRRLAILFPGKHALEIKNEEDKYTVKLILTL